MCLWLDFVAGVLTSGLCKSLVPSGGLAHTWGRKSTELHGYKVHGLTKKSFQIPAPYSSFPHIPLQEKRVEEVIAELGFGLGSFY